MNISTAPNFSEIVQNTGSTKSIFCGMLHIQIMNTYIREHAVWKDNINDSDFVFKKIIEIDRTKISLY